jgi:hypothetical protein
MARIEGGDRLGADCAQIFDGGELGVGEQALDLLEGDEVDIGLAWLVGGHRFLLWRRDEIAVVDWLIKQTFGGNLLFARLHPASRSGRVRLVPTHIADGGQTSSRSIEQVPAVL